MPALIVPKRSLILPRGSRDGVVLPQSQRGFMVVNPARFGGGGSGGDPYFSSVVALLHMDGTNGSTTIPDSTGKHTWSANGNAAISTAQSKFGTGSCAFDGSGDWLTSSGHADFGFGSGDYTVEFWLYADNVAGTQCIFDNRNASNEGIAIYSCISGNSGVWGVANGSATIVVGSVLTTATWLHLAACRQGTTLRIYLNGVQAGTVTDSRTYATTPTPFIGTNYLNSQGLNAYVDDFRITNGVCRYPNGTAFSVPTAAFPDS